MTNIHSAADGATPDGPGRTPAFAFPALALVLAVAVFAGCDTGQSDAAEDREDESTTVLDEPFLRFSFGTVTRERADGAESLQVGETVRSDDLVRLGSSAVAEFQYANAALIRVDGPAEFRVSTRRDSGGVRILIIDLMEGSTIVRTAEDAPDRNVRVRTDSGIVQSQATRYSVSRGKAGDTIVSVAEGQVRVLPSSVDPDDLSDLTAAEDVLSVLGEISDSSVFVDADGEVRIRPEDVELASSILRDMREQLRRHREAERPDAEELRTVTTLLRYARDRIAEAGPQIGAASEERLERIDTFSDRSFLSIDEDAADSPAGDLSRLRVETDPADAEVYLDGLPIGDEIFSSLFEPGETVRLEVRRRGYETEEVEVTFEDGLDESISVSLSRLEPDVSDTELVSAIEDGQADVVRRFLETGGDPDRAVSDGNSPLELSFGAGRPISEIIGSFTPHSDIVDELLQAGADPDSVFSGRESAESSLTPLSSVILAGLYRSDVDYELIDRLLEAGATPDIVVETGEMSVTSVALPIIIGIEQGRVELPLLRRLIEAGGDVSRTVVYDGRLLSPLSTALALGADHGYDPADVVDVLADAGASLTQRVRIGGSVWTPLEFAEEAGLEQSAEVLRDNGA
ncbi:MAG: FecR domain-containing protein [Spirochaetales bacterium]